MKNFLIFCISLAVLLSGGSIFYYFVVFKPNHDAKILEIRRSELEYKKKAEIKKQEKEENKAFQKSIEIQSIESERDKCISRAHNFSSENWDNECKRLKVKGECALPNHLADRLDKLHKEEIERCMEIYKEKLKTLK